MIILTYMFYVIAGYVAFCTIFFFIINIVTICSDTYRSVHHHAILVKDLKRTRFYNLVKLAKCRTINRAKLERDHNFPNARYDEIFLFEIEQLCSDLVDILCDPDYIDMWQKFTEKHHDGQRDWKALSLHPMHLG
jgi:hypothetical protein